MKREEFTEEQLQLFRNARAWAKEHGAESMKKAIEKARLGAERMKNAQEPMRMWYKY